MVSETTLQTQKQVTKRTIDVLLAQYAESHQHPNNEKIHLICVPLIVWSVLALIWRIQPVAALICAALCLGYYFHLSKGFALGMTFVLAGMLGVLLMLPMAMVLRTAVTVFVLGWIGQFIGHHIEGKKPSFFDDVRFLLIGPLFVLSIVYRRWHLAY
ncbi:MAG: DUF962 domain-containing protein [Burkholderiaceae bacterium]|nr:DUF962 domain-containing protein [Burkholderiaceae bacterium]